MDKPEDKSPAKDEKIESEAAKSSDECADAGAETPRSKATGTSLALLALPFIESPKLDGSEPVAGHDIPTVIEMPKPDAAESAAEAEETPSEPAEEPAAEQAAPAAAPRSWRFAMLAATIALAAALGSFIGSLSASGLLQILPAPAAATRSVQVSDSGQVIGQGIKSALAELSALKANLDGATRNVNAQFTKLAERLDRIERAEADPAAKLTHITEAVDRLDKRSAAAVPETTASIASKPGPGSSAVDPNEIVDGWTVQGVQNGRAIVANRLGGIFEVGAGSFLPGLGRIEEVRREDGRWFVFTARGVVTSAR